MRIHQSTAVVLGAMLAFGWRVAAAMGRAMEDAYGNPSSPHWAGAPARRMVEAARRQGG